MGYGTEISLLALVDDLHHKDEMNGPCGTINVTETTGLSLAF